jgi:hypothetical protein
VQFEESQRELTSIPAPKVIGKPDTGTEAVAA